MLVRVDVRDLNIEPLQPPNLRHRLGLDVRLAHPPAQQIGNQRPERRAKSRRIFGAAGIDQRWNLLGGQHRPPIDQHDMTANAQRRTRAAQPSAASSVAGAAAISVAEVRTPERPNSRTARLIPEVRPRSSALIISRFTLTLSLTTRSRAACASRNSRGMVN